MCGIVGYYLKNKDKSISEENLLSAVKQIKHRGPDNSSIYLSESSNLGLGHTRLSIQDTSSSANQPMVSYDNRFTIVFNGEIYNFVELKEYLKDVFKVNLNWKTNSDTEVLLNLFAYFTKSSKPISDFLSLLNGIFSLAIWDAQTNKLLVARDALGVKPLYYVYDDNGFIFSSEIKSLVHLGIKLNQTNHVALDRYLTYIWSPGEETPTKNVKKFMPGKAIVITNGVIQTDLSWYQLPGINPSRKINKKSDCIELTRNYIRQAVKRQLISNVPVGAFLSGGLDSSCIVNYAKEFNPDIDCFTIKSIDTLKNDGFVDDYPYALKVAKHLNVNLHVVEVNNDLLINSIEEMIYQLDEPIADPASINVLLISKLARKLGIKVLLSGTGGDDLFSGYRRHLALNLESIWNDFPLSVRKLIKNGTSNLKTGYPLLRRLKEAFKSADLDPEERIIEYFRWIDQKNLKRLYSDSFLKSIDGKSSNSPINNFLSKLSPEITRLEKMLLIEQKFYLPDHNLLYTDKMSMKEGVEVRVPFLDLDLVNFSSQIPIKYKQNGIQGKWILKKAMEPFLPKEIIYRPKTGFGVPIRKWIKDELKDWISDNLSYAKINSRGLFNPKAVRSLIDANQNDLVDASWTIFSLVCIEIWFKKFKDSYP